MSSELGETDIPSPVPLQPKILEETIQESELIRAVVKHRLIKLTLVRMEQGYYVIAELRGPGLTKRIMTTRREQLRPRLFKDLNKLVKFINDRFGIENFEHMWGFRQDEP